VVAAGTTGMVQMKEALVYLFCPFCFPPGSRAKMCTMQHTQRGGKAEHISRVALRTGYSGDGYS